MKHITEKLDTIPEHFKILDFYLPDDSYAILDIETTGLSPAYSSVVVVGMIIVSKEEITLHQLFATSPSDELEVLSNTAKLLSSCTYIITFNGRFFDVPFLYKRGNKHGVEIPELFNLDLFVLLKYYSDLPKILPRMNQKTIEEYAGISSNRSDTISGAESVELYNKYLETGEKDLERRILLHNSDDVKQLLGLMTLIRNSDVHKSFNKTGFPISDGRITGIDLKKADLIIKGISNTKTEYIAFPSLEAPYHFQMSGKDGSFEITLPCESKDNSVYVDIKTLLDDSAREVLSILPFYVNDYLILKEKNRINYLEINLLARELSKFALSRL